MALFLAESHDWLIEERNDRLSRIPIVARFIKDFSEEQKKIFLAEMSLEGYDGNNVTQEQLDEVYQLVTEDEFFNPGQLSFEDLKHLPGRHDQRTHGRRRGGAKFKDRDITGGVVSPEKRVWQGQQHQNVPRGQRLKTTQKGFIGEEIAMVALEQLTGQPFTELNIGRNNAPIDVSGDHMGVEVKTGSAASGKSSRAWRATIGEPGPAEKGRRKTMTRAEKQAESDKKRAAIMQRKADMLQELTRLNDNQRMNAQTVGVILSPDGRRGDAFLMDGFHLYMGWAKGATEENYLGTFEVGDQAHATMLTKALTQFWGVFMKGVISEEHLLWEYPQDQVEELGLTPAEVDILAIESVANYLWEGDLDDIAAMAQYLAAMDYDPQFLTEDILDTVWAETQQAKVRAAPDTTTPEYKAYLEEVQNDWDQAINDTIDDFEDLRDQGFFQPPADTGKAIDWRHLVENVFSRVMGLIHLAMRMAQIDEDQIYQELLAARKTEYEQTITGYMEALGKEGVAVLNPGPEMDRLIAQSRKDAKAIVETYNGDLAKVIMDIRESTPTANRSVYAKRLNQWEESRNTWKLVQISLNTTMTAKDQALRDFAKHNKLAPPVTLTPNLAKEPICQGWANRGLISFDVAKNNPSPYHVGCVHFWQPQFDNVNGDILELWTG